ncbi:hypothetical protein GCM10010954_36160 [Halobacillus andaensis]|uniref:Uncharacterized protein n=1 Tax=Halobacillus andaensis TaxID=1176239 RepID=A0A917EYD7_HALAA|nr:hypothetical protein [Halobacillus andaensis]MBP2006269.1 hypothetical protein [Halobacillus andaensis]GGF33873.1 hypothetical protein GCM10010954_36160 [Halobacillus andaensis]
MNELMDRRLKKMNHKVKYNKVPMDQHDASALIVKVRNHTHQPSRKWIKYIFPVPAVAVVAFMFLQINYQPSNSSEQEISFLTQRSLNTEMKSQQFIINDEAQQNIEQASNTENSQSSTMVRHTYIIYNDNMYVQTDEQVDESALEEPIGHVKPETPAEQQRGASVTSEEKIFSVKGTDPNDLIAIKSRRNKGIGSTAVSQHGYFIFEKEEALPMAQ